VIPKKESLQTLYDLEHEKTTVIPKPKLLKFTNNDPRNDLTDNASVPITQKPFTTLKEAEKKTSRKSLKNLSVPISVNPPEERVKQNPNTSNKSLPNEEQQPRSSSKDLPQ
jgi:hypothetical protein